MTTTPTRPYRTATTYRQLGILARRYPPRTLDELGVTVPR